MEIKKQMNLFKTFLEKDRNIKIVVILGVLGMVFILFSEFTGSEKKQEKIKTEQYTNSYEYVAYMEQKVHKIVSSIKGVGDPQVMITLESSGENVYAQEEKKNTDSSSVNSTTGDNKVQTKDTYEESVVIIDANGNRSALVKTQLEPKIKGVVIVCKGGGDSVVKESIVETITTALQISSARVSITEKS